MTENNRKMQKLPTGWALANIYDLISNNGLFCDGDWIETKDQNSNGNVRLIQLADIGDGVFRNRSDRHLTYEKSVELGCTYLSKGDLLIARLPDPLGRACLFPLEGEKQYVTAVDICIVRPNSENLNIKLLLYLINSPQIRTEVDKFKSGSTRKRISRKNLAKIQLSIAPTLEQHQIVAKIEELFSELDNGIESLKKAREQLKTYRQAVLKYAFEGKLTKEWRTQHLPAGRQGQAGTPPEPAEKLLERIKAEREKHYQRQLEDWEKACEQSKTEGKKKPTKPKKPKELPPLTEKELAELPELPEGWMWAKVGDISESMKNGIYKPKEFYAEEGIPCLRMYNIENGKIEWFDIKRMILSENEIKEYELKPGDLLVNRVNSRELVGKTGLIKKSIETSVYESKNIRLRLSNKIDSGYVNFWFLIYANGYFNRNAQQTVGMASINQEQLGKMPLPVCSETEQYQIFVENESRLSVCDKLENTIEDSLKKAEYLRQSILKKAFNGELTREWRQKNLELISGENSAEKLLERIKAEKEKTQSKKAKKQ